MTSAGTAVTKEGMLAAAERMEGAREFVLQRRRDVENMIDSLSGFTGSAAMTYRRAMTAWFGNVDTIVTALNEMIRIMQEGAQTVGQTDVATEAEAAAGAQTMASYSNAGLAGL